MSATLPEQVEVARLVRTPYIRILTYPKISLPVAKSRISQLKRIGVEELVFEGKTRIGRLGILGLGTVSVVVKAKAHGQQYALKIRRTDANRPDMANEVNLTLLANRVGIGAPVVAQTKDLVLMKLLEYVELYDWFKALRGPGSREKARKMVHLALNQCRMLDIMGLDHGQLSNLRKHLVVAEGRPWIIDFESAGTSRKPKNLTTATQHLFIGGKMSATVRRAMGIRSTAPLLKILRSYKVDMSDYWYAKMLESLKISLG